jgi:hypothetical protein
MDDPPKPLRRWRLRMAALWGLGTGLLLGAMSVGEAADRGDDIGYALLDLRDYPLGFALAFVIVAAIRNRFLPAHLRK